MITKNVSQNTEKTLTTTIKKNNEKQLIFKYRWPRQFLKNGKSHLKVQEVSLVPEKFQKS